MKLKQGFKDEYKKRSDAVWTDQKALMQSAGEPDYWILPDVETDVLFAFQNRAGEVSTQDSGFNSAVKKGRAYMADIYGYQSQ